MLLDLISLIDIVNKAKKEKKKIVFTNGCFDIIHPGHISYLYDSKRLGDILIIGLNSDDSVKILKGTGRPINNQRDRSIVLDAIKPVDYVVIFEEDTPFKLINAIKPDILTKGGDYIAENIVGYNIVTENGGEVVVINYVDGKSTTSIINKLNK